jgi:uncharacterized protein
MDNRAVVQTIYSAADTADLASVDMAAIESVLADDVVLYEPPNHPAVLTDDRATPGVWRGRDEVMNGIAKVFIAIRLTGADLETLVVDGDRVVGLLNAKGTDLAGNPYAMPMAEVFRVKDGKVTEIRAFYFDVAQLGSLVLPDAATA